MEPRLDQQVSLAPGFLVTFAGARILRFPHLSEPALSGRSPAPLRSSPSSAGTRAGRSVPPSTRLPNGPPPSGSASCSSSRRWAKPSSWFPARYPVGSRPPPCAPSRTRRVFAPDQPLTFAKPVSLLVEDGEFLWFDHSGVLRLPHH